MKNFLWFLTVLFVFSTLPIDAVHASDDWPQWRGPNRDGHSPDKGLLKEWPADGPKLVWKATGLGIGYTNVSVVGRSHLYRWAIRTTPAKSIALNVADGKPLWKAKVGKAGAPGWGGFAGPRCTPTVDGNLVFAVGQYGEVGLSRRCLGQGNLAERLHQGFRRRIARVGILRHAAGRWQASDPRARRQTTAIWSPWTKRPAS